MSQPSPPIGSVIDMLCGQGMALWLEDGRLHFRGSEALVQHPAFEAVKARKAEAIAYLAAHGGGVRVGLDHRPEMDRAPLNPAQRLWLQQARLGLPQHNLLRAITLFAPLDRARLDAALRALFAEHAALRQRLVEIGATAEMLEDKQASPEVVVRPAETSEAELQAAAMAPFDLSAGRTMRVQVVPKDSEHLLFLSWPELLLGGDDASRLTDDLVRLYKGLGLLRPSDAGRLRPIDHALWMAETPKAAAAGFEGASSWGRGPRRALSPRREQGVNLLRSDAAGLSRAVEATGIAPAEVVMAAIYLALSRWRDRARVKVAVLTPSLRPLPMAHVAGCYAAFAPMGIDTEPGLDLAIAARRVAEAGRALTLNLGQGPADEHALDIRAMSFARQGPAPSQDVAEATHAPMSLWRAPRLLLIGPAMEILAWTSPGEIEVKLQYAEDAFGAEEIEQFGQGLIAVLTQTD